MKRLSVIAIGSGALALGLSAFVIGCGGGSSTPSQPSSGPTTASQSFTVQLSPANESPSIAGAEASASGTATIVINTTKDGSGAITAATANFQMTTSGFPAGSTITMAHIHPGAAGSNGGILVNTGLASGDMGLTNGAGSATKNSVNVPADVATNILNNPAGYYFNIHSAVNPSGVLRGQLAGGSSSGGSGGGSGDPGPGY